MTAVLRVLKRAGATAVLMVLIMVVVMAVMTAAMMAV